MGRRRKWELLVVWAAIAAASAAAIAAETIDYRYDARGRLVRVEHSGSVNNNVATNYTFDKADNRTAKTTTGSPNPPPP
jgi:YD repeat-containing protein